MSLNETLCGFQWDTIEVIRLSDFGRVGKVLGIKTPREEIHIRVTPSGLIRIYVIEKRGKT